MFETRIYISSVKFLYDKKEFEKYYKLVPEYRRNKIDSYQTQKDKCLSLGAGLILSLALKEAGLNEDELEYAYKESGMPYFKNCPEVYFSLSHSEEKVMCGISENPIGVDVELIKDGKDDEYSWWTKTESYAKATDTRLATLLDGKTVFNTEFRFKNPEYKDGYKYSVCSEEFINDTQINYTSRM